LKVLDKFLNFVTQNFGRLVYSVNVHRSVVFHPVQATALCQLFSVCCLYV